MLSEEQAKQRIAELEAELAVLEKVNRALISRVERSTDSAGNAFSLFESNIILQQKVNERTQDLQQSNSRLQSEIAEHMRTESELRRTQHQTRLIIDTALDAVIAFNQEWNILDWNPRAETTFGYDAEFAREKLSVAAIVAPGQHTILQSYLSERSQKGSSGGHTLELVGRHRDGHEIPIEIAVSVLSGGESPIYSAFIRDITERKLAEEARYRTLFDNSPVGLLEGDFSELKKSLAQLGPQDADTLEKQLEDNPELLVMCISLLRIVDVNQATVKLADAPSREYYLANFAEIFRRAEPKLFSEGILALARGESSAEIEAFMLTFEGRTIELLVSLSIAPGFEETWGKVLISVQDLTERKRAEREKTKLESQLRQSQKMETVGTLAGGIAHDFNNMLAPILGYAEMIADEANDNTEVRQATEQIISAARRARDLVRQILTFSRQVEQPCKPVRLAPLIGEALELVRATLPATVNLRFAPSDHSTVVMADSTQIHQVVLNLCTNAYQSLEHSSGTIDIELRDFTIGPEGLSTAPGLVPGRYACLTVRDDGSGIEESIVNRIFEPFFTTKEVGKGTGMGLAVTHGIVKGLGGDIGVESKLAQGSSFHVYLPIVDAQPIPETKMARAETGHGRILIVDDEPMVADVTSRMLERLGYSTTTAKNAVEALRIFQESPNFFDAIVTDETMPDLPGHLLAREAKLIRAEVPIILLTGYSQMVSTGDEAKLGVNEILLKPVDINNLSGAVERALIGIVKH